MKRRVRAKRLGLALAGLVALYVLLAYLVLPLAWTRYEDRRVHPAGAMVTTTAQGIAGDPLNVGVVGERGALLAAMRAANWFPADPVTLRSSLEIVGSVVLDRPYRDAPVSALYHDGRREDLAFEKPVGRSADRRQHVRFWREERPAGRPPLWLGAVTFDAGVGFSRYTGTVTHDIAPAIDAARDGLAADLEATGQVARRYAIKGVGATARGRNGEGDPYATDGMAEILVLTDRE